MPKRGSNDEIADVHVRRSRPRSWHLATMTAAKAQSVADFYRGKTITYNLAVPDGASWGLYARTFIEHLRKHIPGNPNIILQVMPGGGGVAAGNHIFNVAVKDGTVIGTPLSTAMVFAATDPESGEVRPAQVQLDRIDGRRAGRHHGLAHGAGQDLGRSQDASS